MSRNELIKLPRLYAIIDAACFADAEDSSAAISNYARHLLAGGVTLVQYRNKNGNARQVLADARELQRTVAAMKHMAPGVHLIMNDRADLCLAADFAGVHVGQDDLSPVSVRALVGPDRWVGVSTHNPEQVREAEEWPVDYVAVGPVFATGSKANPDPVIGIEGVRVARSLTNKPLVAIGGITRKSCAEVFAAGADSVAVIGDLLREPEKAAGEFLKM